MSYWVYVHTCPNGKRYVGVTTKLKPEYRWGKNGEGYCQNKHFYSAILKYGWDNIEHEVFEVDSKEEMYRKEVELISFYHSNDPEYGYNNSSGGESGHLGCKHSEGARKKMSKARKGKPTWNKGKPCSEETKRKIAETLKGRHPSEEARKHIAEANRRKAKDPEFRKHMSEAQKRVQKKVHSDPEYRRKLSEAKKGKPQPKIKIKLPDGTIVEISKFLLTRWYINRGRKFEYVS